MLSSSIRRRLRRFLAMLGVPLIAIAATVALTGTPAQAATVMGTFRILSGDLCLEVHPGGTGNGILVLAGICNTENDRQRWRIMLDEGRNVYWIQAFAGAWPLNKCMDGPDSSAKIHIWGCHGGHQQRWLLAVGPFASSQIRQANTNECVGILAGQFLIQAFQQICTSSPPPPIWTLIPA